MDGDRRKTLLIGGLALVGVGSLMLLQKPKPPPAPPAPPAPPPPPPPPPPGPSCQGYQVVGTWPNWDGSLWGIATHWYGNGALYPKIYSANSDLIESTARAHGFASSDAGHWIFPGENLCIPP